MPEVITQEFYTNNWGSNDLDNRTRSVLYRRITKYRSPVVKTAQHALRRREPHIYCPPTPLLAYYYELQNAMGRIRRTAASGSGWESGVADWVSPPNPTSLVDPNYWTPDLQNLAVTRALLKLKDSDVNYSQAIAERNQTFRLVGSSAKKIAGMFTALRHGNIGGAARALGVEAKGNASRKVKQNSKALAEAVLELNYGWKPLLSDNFGMLKDCMEEDSKSPYTKLITVHANASDQTDTGFQYVTSLFNGTPNLQTRTRLQSSRSCRVRLDYVLDDARIAALASGGLLDPATLAWELMPWSFVADWFVPVGNYLQAYNATIGYRFIGGCATSRVEGTGSVDMGRFFHRDPELYTAWSADGGVHYRKIVDRRVFSTSPLPRTPGFKNPFSTTHALNALALLRGSVR